MRSTTSKSLTRASLRLAAAGSLAIAYFAFAAVSAFALPAVPLSGLVAAPAPASDVWDSVALTVDPLGAIIIADTGNSRVLVLAADGTELRVVGAPGSGVGALERPMAVQVGPAGALYVADWEDGLDGSVCVYQADGTFIRRMTAPDGLADLHGVAVDSVGNVYALQRTSAKITKMSPTGDYVGSFGTPGVGNYLLSAPRSIDYYNNRLYVADTGNSRIMMYSTTAALGANYAGVWGVETPASPRYIAPTGVKVSATGGNFLVTDMGRNWVQVVGATSPYSQTRALGTMGTPGAADGYFRAPQNSAMAADGTVYTADTGNNRITRFSPTLGWLPAWQLRSGASGRMHEGSAVAVAEDSSAFAIDPVLNRVTHFDADGSYLESFGTTGTGPGQLSGARGIAVTDTQTVLVADTGNDRILRFTTTGGYLGSFGQGELDAPRGMAFDATGKLLVADSGNDRIVRFDEVTQVDAVIGEGGSGIAQFSSPSDVTVDENGFIWVADTGNNRIQKFNGAGAYMLKFPDQTTSPGSDVGRFNAPEGIGPLEGGGVVVADTVNNRLQEVDDDLNVRVVGRLGAERGLFREPVDVAAAPDRRLWTAEGNGARAQYLVRDDLAPEVTVSGVPTGRVYDNVTVSLTATDTNAGVDYLRYSIDGTTAVAYGGPFAITTEGTHTIAYRAADRVGNAAAATATVVIDRTAPLGSMSAQGGAFWLADPSVDVTNTFASDAYEMRVGYNAVLGEWVPFSSNATVTLPPDEGVYTVAVEVRDTVGNVRRVTQAVGLDRTGHAAPVTQSTNISPGTIGRNVSSAAFSWTAPSDDGMSGIVDYAWTLDDQAATVPAIGKGLLRSASAGVPNGGVWYFHVRARDAAGNWGATRHVQIRTTSRPSVSSPRYTRAVVEPESALIKYSGTVTPVHYPAPVRVSTFKFELGRWVEKQQLAATVREEAGGVLTYRGSVTLGQGKWRLRAVHSHAGYYESAWGPYSDEIVVR